jgi:hypothetical protein
MKLLLTLFGLIPFVIGNCILPITFGENIHSVNCMIMLLSKQVCRVECDEYTNSIGSGIFTCTEKNQLIEPTLVCSIHTYFLRTRKIHSHFFWRNDKNTN